jgi:Skp family chaperone for outer membrane proteins
MRGFAVAASLVLALGAAPVFGQTDDRPAAAREAPTPAQAPAAPAAGAQAPAAPAPQPPAPFPQGAKLAFVNLQAIAQLSTEGKAATAKVQKLTQDKQKEGQAKAKALQANQQKLQTSGTLLSDAARSQLEKDIERQQREGERFEQDAQAEINDLTQGLQSEFNKKLLPVLEQISKEKGLMLLFSATDAGLIWAEPGLDLTMEAVRKLDAAGGSTAASAPAAKPAAPAAPKPAPAKP